MLPERCPDCKRRVRLDPEDRDFSLYIHQIGKDCVDREKAPPLRVKSTKKDDT